MNTEDASRELEQEELLSLIDKAASGSGDALDALLEKYKPLISSEVSRRALEDMTDQDLEDLKQEAVICFCNAVCSYAFEEGGVKFGLYAKICIDNGLISYIRSFVRRRNGNIISLEDSPEPTAVGSFQDPMQKLIEDETFADLRRRIQGCLSPYENRVWWMYVAGAKSADIAKALGVQDVRSVSNAIYRIRKKLRELLG